MCATSGGGFALISEGLGMSAMMETPAYKRPITKVTCLNHAPQYDNMASGANWRQVYQTCARGGKWQGNRSFVLP
jgi:hypothetical protein